MTTEEWNDKPAGGPRMTTTDLAAALIAGVPRYETGAPPDHYSHSPMVKDDQGDWLDRDAVLAALTAALDGVDERAGEVLEGVTPGPWKAVAAGQADDLNEVVVFQPEFRSIADAEGANARFIAWCREGVPALLAQIAALRARNTQLYFEREENAKVSNLAQDRLTAAAEAVAEKLRGAVWLKVGECLAGMTHAEVSQEARARIKRALDAALTTEADNG